MIWLAFKPSRDMFDLSIVVPTLNRAASLASCLASAQKAARCALEVIVVDGASTDSTPAVLHAARESLGDRLQVIREPKREGFVRAANKGFQAARGRYLMWLNDDARPLPGALDRAIEQLEFSPHHVGMVALFHAAHGTRNVAFQAQHLGRSFHVLHVRGTLYANFGMARRSLFERLGHFDERYFLNGADPDFSLKVWHAGLSVVPAFGALIDHDELADDRRETDRDRGAADNTNLFQKWDLPEKDPATNDFDQTRPCTLRGLQTARAA
jgi:GT2 family glycosyltransferase